MKRRYQVKNIPAKRLPAIADGAVWKKGKKMRAATRWDSVVEKVWKDVGGNQEEIMSIDNFGRYETEGE